MTQGLTQEDIELLGPELVDYVRREAAHQVNRLEHRVNDVTTTQRHMQVENNRQHVQRVLDTDPELRDRWRAINTSPEFIRWLDEADPLADRKRIDGLRQAYDLGASDRVRAIFLAYLREKQIPARQRAPGKQDTFTTGGHAPSVTVADADDRRRIWKRGEISRFYQEVRRGAYDGRDAERLRIEAAILEAARTGRVLNPPLKNFGDK